MATTPNTMIERPGPSGRPPIMIVRRHQGGRGLNATSKTLGLRQAR